jgi:asparagine synthase (glutamine-hydrolysing)
MCGFVGAIELSGLQQNIIHNLSRASSYIANRGPDESTKYINNELAIYFHRLAIVGKTNGSQPFISEDSNIVVAVNGEIYNYKELLINFKDIYLIGDSDCEIVLRLYERIGISFTNYIRGIFSIVIYDKRCGYAYLIRDKFGVRPMYFSFKARSLYFASEIKALMAIPHLNITFDELKALSETWLAGYPSYNPNSVCSFFKNVNYLPGGNILRFDLNSGETSQSSYWSPFPSLLSNNQPNKIKSLTNYKKNYKRALEYAVKEECPSDIPAGIFLSGGIDSVVIAYLASKHCNLTSFSIADKSFINNGDHYYAYKAANKFGLYHHTVSINDGIGTLDFTKWVNLIYLCETPYIGPEQIYKYSIYLYVKNNFPKIKVMFSGQGSDELNGGYSTQFGSHRIDGWQQFMMALEYFSTNTYKLNSKILAEWWNRDFPEFPIINSKFIQEEVYLFPKTLESKPWIEYTKNKIRDLQMYNLWHEDRPAGGVGLENRVPFLNDLVTDVILNIPDIYRENLFWDKAILRHSFLKNIGIQFAKREKVPLFYGKGENNTLEMMLQLISHDNFSLIDYAFSNGNGALWLNKDNLILFAKHVIKDLKHKGWEKLVRIINIGLLTNMNKVFI